MKRAILAAMSGVLLLITPAIADEAQNDFAPGRLSLNATGEVRGAPDIATLNAGVVSEGDTAKAALADNRTRMNGVFRALRAAGVKDKDMQTSGLNVSPIYRTVKVPVSSSSERRISGYRVNNQVTAVVRDLQNLGPAIDALVESGANNIGGVTFGLSNQDKALDEARKEAVKVLMAKAKLYADATGFQVGRIVNMSENSGYSPRPMMSMARTMSSEAAPTPIAAGEVSTRVTVNATFEIKQ